MYGETTMNNEYSRPVDHDFLWQHLTQLPYFRAILRAVEARFYQDAPMAEPVLDLGSGDGDFAAQTFAKKLDIGLDPWWAPLRASQARDAHKLLTMAQGAAMPFAENTFGTIVCNSVFEHIPDLEPVIAECFRVLRPGGRLIFCSPTDRFPQVLLGGRIFGEWYRRFFTRIARHVHTDSPQHWRERLTSHGFDIEVAQEYFSDRATVALELGHYAGLPNMLWKALFGRWVLWPSRRDPVLRFVDAALRGIYREEPVGPPATGLFCIAVKPGRA
jgi:SAM-dependent methyltransferase